MAVGIPSGLNANTGNFQDEKLRDLGIRATHTLQLLNAKPGCFTAHGRDACGTMWLEDLGTEALQENTPSAALLNRQPLPSVSSLFALYHNPVLPEIMPRNFKALHLASGVVVCGCGGGIAIQKVLPQVLHESTQLVLDADALNAISQDRLKAAQSLAALFDCTVVLKGSGTVIAQTAHTSVINPTGNARLATAGTGDVFAGVLGARLAQGLSASRKRHLSGHHGVEHHVGF